MLIERVTHKKKFVVELWDEPTPEWEFKEPFGEEFYIDVNNWCVEHLGYHARTAYNRFEFKKEEHLTMFVLRWA